MRIDGQTVGGRGGPTFHDQGGRTNQAKGSVVIDIFGLPLAVWVESARPHDVSAGHRLLDSADGNRRRHAHRPALPRRAHLRSAGVLAAAVSLLRGDARGARARPEVAALGCRFARLRAEPA